MTAHRTPAPPRRAVPFAVVALVAATLAVPATPAGAEPAVKPASTAVTGAGPRVVTLITGDRVAVTGAGVVVEETAPRPDGRAPSFQMVSTAQGLYVYPDDAQTALRTGLLDRELFNVRYLAENGYADTDTDRLPVIVTYAPPAARADGRRLAPDAKVLSDRAGKLPATAGAVGLTSVNGAAVRVDKGDAERLWHTLRDAGAVAPGPASSRVPAAPDARPRTVWLDRKLRVSLADSVPRIGAPKAWQAGYDGRGSTVAVLDSGVDAAHPDLAGKIGATRSFIEGTDATDRHGHGTHVASTIAGSGAASGGRHTGVAPGARLLVGKVCTDTGECPTSAVIAGMQWAAESGADIVSMSLGGCCTDGTDPQSQAVNELSASTGALFVIAAGNDGPGAQTVGSPGVADAALTVAATDKSDAMAGFSSRGPRADGALKPDIAAPGVGIVAARAAGTSMGTPVDDHHTTADGTSMATPHVAGAAAILAQRHPGWRAPQLKAALMSTAHNAGHTVYEQGAGRVDVGRAATQLVYAETANADFGRVAAGEGPQRLSKQVTYRNLTDRSVTLTLTPTLRTVGGAPAAGGALTADRTVTLPPGGTGTATLTLDLAGLAPEVYSGGLLAVDDAAGVRLTTPVGLDRRVPLDIHVLGPDGKPTYASGVVFVTAVDGVAGDVFAAPVDVGRYRVLVRPGTYSIVTGLNGVAGDTSRRVSAVLMDPQVSVAGPTIARLDASKAVPVSVATPRPADPYSLAVNYERTHVGGAISTWGITGSSAFAQEHLYATPTERATVGTFRFSTQWALANPQTTLTARGREKLVLHPIVRAYADRGITFNPATGAGWLPFTGRGRYELVDAGFGDRSDLAGKDLRGKLALMGFGDDRWGATVGDPPDGNPDSTLFADRINNLHAAGAAGVVIFSDPPPGWENHQSFTIPAEPQPVSSADEKVRIPDVQIPRDEGKRLRALLRRGPVSVDLVGDPHIRYSYQLLPYEEGRVRPALAHRYGEGDLARVESVYHASKPLPAATTEGGWRPGGGPLSLSQFEFAVPRTLTHYYGPLDHRTVRHGTVSYHDGGSGIWREEAARVFKRPGRTAEHWGAQPAAPGAAASLDPALLSHPNYGPGLRTCVMCREGNLLFPISHQITGNHHLAYHMGTTSVRLHGPDGAQIPLQYEGFLPAFPLPPERGRYRLVETKQDPDSTTTWTFTSAAPTRDTAKPGTLCWLGRGFGHKPCHPEPFIFLRYDLTDHLGLDNTVAAGIHRFVVTAYNGQSTVAQPRIAGLRVWTSADGGQRWQPAVVAPHGQGGRDFTVVAKHPRRTGGVVSVRVEAWDVDGNRVEQVLERAY